MKLNNLVLLFMAHSSTILFAQHGEPGVEIFKKHDAPVKAVAFSADGSIMATGGDDKMIYLWDTRTAELSGSITNPFAVKALQFAGNDMILAACGTDVKLIDLQGEIIRSFGGYTTEIWSIHYNRPTQRLVAGSYAKTIRIWDFSSGKNVLTLHGHEKSCLPVRFNPPGDHIASGSLDRSVRIWNASTGLETQKLEIHSENIFAIDYHPSGRYFVSASGDKTIRLWSADSGKIVKTYTGHTGSVFDVRFSEDGNHLLSCSGDGTIILWETATGNNLHSFTDHTGIVNSIRFAPGGMSFASVSDDHTVRFWQLEKRYYIEKKYKNEIEQAISGSPLFAPRGGDETRQTYSEREKEADKFLQNLYDELYTRYIQEFTRLSP
jgi:WD40 repeat protein